MDRFEYSVLCECVCVTGATPESPFCLHFVPINRFKRQLELKTKSIRDFAALDLMAKLL